MFGERLRVWSSFLRVDFHVPSPSYVLSYCFGICVSVHMYDISSWWCSPLARAHHNTPATRHLQNHTYRTSFHTLNQPTITVSHRHSLHSPHPYSISHMGYTRPPWRPQGSHCTRIQGWIALLGPVLVPVVYPIVKRGLIRYYTPCKLT